MRRRQRAYSRRPKAFSPPLQDAMRFGGGYVDAADYAVIRGRCLCAMRSRLIDKDMLLYNILALRRQMLAFGFSRHTRGHARFDAFSLEDAIDISPGIGFTPSYMTMRRHTFTLE